MTMVTEDPRMIEMHAVTAIRAGRNLVTLWEGCPLFLPVDRQQRMNAMMANLALGRVCRRADDETLDALLGAVADMLDTVSPGYGAVFRDYGTDELAFFDPDAEAIRRMGEALKAFCRARRRVIDLVLAEREIAAVMRERG